MNQEISHLGPSRRISADETSLLDYGKVILKRKKMVVAIVVFASVTSVIASSFMTKIYRAEATIMPISGGSGLSALAGGGIGGLVSLAGIPVSGAGKDEMKIMAILQSRNIAENIVNKLDLMKMLFEESWDNKTGAWKGKSPTIEDAALALKGFAKFILDKKNNLVIIAVEHKDPKFAATLANTYVEELQNLINEKSFSMSKRNRIFIEGQLKENKKEFLEAGKAISSFYGRNNVSSIDADIDVSLGDEDLWYKPDKLANAVDELIQKKAEVEAQIEETKVENVPQQVYLSYLMLKKELLAKISGMLNAQYAMAKIEEVQEDIAFQVIDDAVVPTQKFKPSRARIAIFTFITSLFLAIFLVFFMEYFERMRSHPNAS